MLAGVSLPVLEIGPVRIAPFATMLAGGILCGHYATRWRARNTGLDAALANMLFAWMVWFAFAGSLAWRVADNPARFWDVPLLWGTVFEEMSSLPAIAAGTLGAVAFLSWAALPLTAWFRYLDCAAWAFPFGWLLARLGCSLTHGHPGRGGVDLALLEAAAAAALALLFLAAGSRPFAPGWITGALLVGLAAVRLALYPWRFDPPLLAGLPVERLACLLAVMSGGLLLYGARLVSPGKAELV
ncbi:MAG: prolipoprotein diacylglyceryl transferase [Bryobacteraceae bacterium]